MSMTWGPGLDAELAYRREQVAGAVAGQALPRSRRRDDTAAAPAAPRAVPVPRRAESAPVAQATGARAA